MVYLEYLIFELLFFFSVFCFPVFFVVICDAPTIQESDLQDAVVKAIQEVSGGKDVFLPVLEKNIREVLKSESGEQIGEIDCKLEELQQELL